MQSEYEMVRSRFVSYLEEVFARGLQPPNSRTFHEILFFRDVSNVKKQIVGSPRGAIHMALSNPIHYLQVNNSYTHKHNFVSTIIFVYDYFFDLLINL